MKISAIALLAVLFMTLFSRLFGASSHEDRKQKIVKQEATLPPTESIERKRRSMDFLKSKGITVMQGLPFIEDSGAIEPRSTRELAERFVACTIAAVAGETGDAALVKRIVSDFMADSFLSPEEKKFLTRDLDNQKNRIQYSWRYERSWVLLWALGYVESLEFPPKVCDVPRIAKIMSGNTVAQLIAGAKPCPINEILDEADMIYRLHWAVVEERVNQSMKLPADIEKGVVLERHAALNWLVRYLDQEWDEITTDT